MDSTQNTFGSFQNSRFSDGLIREGISFFEEYSSFSFCQIDSVRDADEHPTSRRIDSIRRESDFSSEERLEKASSVYEAWRKKNSGSTSTVVLDYVKDCEYPTVRLGRLYIAKYLRELGIIDRLRRLRGEDRAKYRFDLAAIVEMLIVSRLLVSFSLKYWLKEMAELKEKKACIEALAQSGTEISGFPKELSGYAKMGHVTKDVEAVMEELKGMQGRILPTEDGRKVILRAEKDRLSMLMAKQFLRIDTLEKYSRLKIEKKE
ncbi:MAG: hypothetical protein SOX76_01500 [Candidatus Enterosoma sp.]|nr:hypothetical protein [Candidatus Enterosoma sp.]